jgi:hypothetical protein
MMPLRRRKYARLFSAAELVDAARKTGWAIHEWTLTPPFGRRRVTSAMPSAGRRAVVTAYGMRLRK